MNDRQVVCGVRSCTSILKDARSRISALWFIRETRSTALRELQMLARQRNIHYLEVSRQELNQLSSHVRHQGVVLEYTWPQDAVLDFPALLASPNQRLLLVLDQVQDPRNLGACVRCADATGVDAVIIPRSRSAKLTAAVAKAASGALAQVPVLQVSNLSRCLKQLRQVGYWLLGTGDDTATELYAQEIHLPLALILGNEATGLRHNTRQLCDNLVHIPMFGTVKNLNVSVACGIMLYEIRRHKPFLSNRA